MTLAESFCMPIYSNKKQPGLTSQPPKLMRTYGIPLRCYVDSLLVFHFVQRRDSFWRKHVLQTDEADNQRRKVMKVLGVYVIYAPCPKAKGKVETQE